METKEKQTPGEPSDRTQVADTHRFHTWRSTFWQFLRYCLVGGANTLIDWLTLNVLLWRFSTNNVQVLVLYNSIAYTSGALSSFFFNKYSNFGTSRERHGRSWCALLSACCLKSSLAMLWSGWQGMHCRQ